jgi:hypothetical protein
MRCEEMSWLLKSQCAHCLGHTLDEDYEAVAM